MILGGPTFGLRSGQLRRDEYLSPDRLARRFCRSRCGMVAASRLVLDPQDRPFQALASR